MVESRIFDVPLGKGRIGICQMPGRGDRVADLQTIKNWGANLVLTMTTLAELDRVGMGDIEQRLTELEISWRHLPIEDFGAPNSSTGKSCIQAAAHAHKILQNGGSVLAHCWGGCGRSGMALLRLMVEAGEPVDAALARLRKVRPCAVETPQQKKWAASGTKTGNR